jgi:hypothetical protein
VISAGHAGELLGGMAASLITFPEHGMAVSVISNISYANTLSFAAFAKQRKLPASK